MPSLSTTSTSGPITSAIRDAKFIGVNPRTAFGLSQDRHYMYLMVIDGRQSGYSDGALDWETAKWLQLLGAADGADMDGGGSSCMVIQSSTGAPVELNRDSAAAVGRCRANGWLAIWHLCQTRVRISLTMSWRCPDDTAATITWTTIHACHDAGGIWAYDQLRHRPPRCLRRW